MQGVQPCFCTEGRSPYKTFMFCLYVLYREAKKFACKGFFAKRCKEYSRAFARKDAVLTKHLCFVCTYYIARQKSLLARAFLRNDARSTAVLLHGRTQSLQNIYVLSVRIIAYKMPFCNNTTQKKRARASFRLAGAVFRDEYRFRRSFRRARSRRMRGRARDSSVYRCRRTAFFRHSPRRFSPTSCLSLCGACSF